MPAVALAAALRRVHPQWRVLLVAADRAIEAGLLPSRDFPYQLLPAEPLYRKQWWKNFRWPLLALRLRREVDRLLDREQPAGGGGAGGGAGGSRARRGRGAPRGAAVPPLCWSSRPCRGWRCAGWRARFGRCGSAHPKRVA